MGTIWIFPKNILFNFIEGKNIHCRKLGIPVFTFSLLCLTVHIVFKSKNGIVFKSKNGVILCKFFLQPLVFTVSQEIFLLLI